MQVISFHQCFFNELTMCIPLNCPIWHCLLSISSATLFIYYSYSVFCVSDLISFCQGCQTRTKPIARPDSGSNRRALLKFVVRQAGVEIGKQVCRGQFQSCGRGANVGRIRADEGVVPGSRQSRSRGQTWVGAGQTRAWYQGAGRVGVGGRHGSEPGR